MVAEGLAEPVQRVALGGVHEKHEIGAQQQVDSVHRDSQQSQKGEATGNIPQLGPDIAAGSEHDGIDRQKDVDGGAVQMHEITEGQGCPGGEKKSGRGGRNAHGVEKAAQQPTGPHCVYGNEKDVDTAQVEGEVAVQEVSTDQQTDHFEELVCYQQYGE